jgi:hypothetical protein
MLSYTPSLPELYALTTVRPWFVNQPTENVCPYCGSPSKWHTRLLVYRIESGKATDGLRAAEHLIHWIGRKGRTVTALDERMIEEFVEHLNRCRCARYGRTHRRDLRKGARLFLRYAQFGDLGTTRAVEEVSTATKWASTFSCASKIEEDSFHYERKKANIEEEQNLDGIYVIRTNVKKEVLSSQEVVASYKSLSGVERAFRSLKTVDLQVRPIHHRLPDRVRAHILLCVLAYYVERHMRQLLAPMLFDDDDKPQAQTARTAIVAPAQRSTSAKLKALTKQTADGTKVHSFQTLIGDLATIVKSRIQPADKSLAVFDMLTQPTVIQQRALDLLGVTLRP